MGRVKNLCTCCGQHMFGLCDGSTDNAYSLRRARRGNDHPQSEIGILVLIYFFFDFGTNYRNILLLGHLELQDVSLIVYPASFSHKR